VWFGEQHPFPERESPTRLRMSGQQSYKGWSCRVPIHEVTQNRKSTSTAEEAARYSCTLNFKRCTSAVYLIFSTAALVPDEEWRHILLPQAVPASSNWVCNVLYTHFTTDVISFYYRWIYFAWLSHCYSSSSVKEKLQSFHRPVRHTVHACESNIERSSYSPCLWRVIA
jgi:hypothetical protein